MPHANYDSTTVICNKYYLEKTEKVTKKWENVDTLFSFRFWLPLPYSNIAGPILLVDNNRIHTIKHENENKNEAYS